MGASCVGGQAATSYLNSSDRAWSVQSGDQRQSKPRDPVKLLAATCVAILLAACASVSQPQRPVREGPTYDGQRDLEALVSFISGNWDSVPREPPLRLRVVEFWKGSNVRWVYFEWVRKADETKATRQIVMRIAEDGVENIMTATSHRLPGDGTSYVGEWRKPEPFAGLRPADLREIPGCRLVVTRTMIAHFTLTTEAPRCPGDIPGSPFMRLEFSFSSSELQLLEEPRDAEGKLLPKLLDPYNYGRMSRAPK